MSSPGRLRHALRLMLRAGLLVLVFILLLAGAGWWYLHPASEVTRGIVYGQRNGRELTLEVHRPKAPNGIGVLIMVSGKWKSHPGKFRAWMAAPSLRAGHTVFAVSHIAQPEASVPETVEDIHRAARFVRHHARDYGVDPRRLAVTGGSSGGHLSLMLATRGGPGPADAPDPVDREDSSVQAAAVFFPVTDLLNLGPSTENDGTGGPPKSFKKSFGPEAADLEKWKLIGREVSPIFHITPRLPPVLIAHGDADTLVPLDQSERFQKRAAELGHDIRVLVRPGARHGWLTIMWDVRRFAEWFNERLAAL
ncbi:MAG TPA: alpha/beta hydrolase [Prosthecobacter sp.]|nr:alpha/beta hydrolase [Prosthecobacter sp.]HRK12730.1 alpha/beta hydrolase [Prosthecobacter sp.]